MDVLSVTPEMAADASIDGAYMASDARQLYRSSILDEEELVVAAQQEVASRRRKHISHLNKHEKNAIADRVVSIGLRCACFSAVDAGMAWRCSWPTHCFYRTVALARSCLVR
jgi:hypothetical protein